MPLILAFAVSAALQVPCTSAADNASAYDWRQCMSDHNERLDLELEQIWRKAVATAEQEDSSRVSSGGMHDKEGQIGRLRKAQIAWHRFRDAQCETETYSMYGGTGMIGVWATCRARITSNRIEELKLFVREN